MFSSASGRATLDQADFQSNTPVEATLQEERLHYLSNLKALLGIRVCHGGKLGAPLGDAGGRALKGRWRAPDVGLRPPPVSASRAILIVISRSFTAIRRRVAAALIGRIIGGAPSSTGMTSFFAAAGAWD
eukprot:CAMPEP_0177425858 /NCGR_PEP_ID=MMETSP0368-20130122/73235_1 /TAXON_ID=447022 ORGANISM="Scrippsiella hangoei-like, Strain SHHI-4" /NCGR_SAMPLE_ID=MMETSP0368 /ASSEMBLY_ACC=CAM_ASM_000363 /LENGTH=129 /DNA_ID=CAMNT_0018896189 /DNA_START=129 /DNA_END=519 /DNA_ORIENTATION=-